MVHFKERKPKAHAGSDDIGFIVGSTKYPEGAGESAEKGATTRTEDEVRAQRMAQQLAPSVQVGAQRKAQRERRNNWCRVR